MSIQTVLQNLANGLYDGKYTESESNGVSWGYYIADGTPIKYRDGKDTKYFDGKENIRHPGKRKETRFESSEQKENFFKKYGFINDMFYDCPEVQEVSHAYYEAIKGK